MYVHIFCVGANLLQWDWFWRKLNTILHFSMRVVGWIPNQGKYFCTKGCHGRGTSRHKAPSLLLTAGTCASLICIVIKSLPTQILIYSRFLFLVFLQPHLEIGYVIKSIIYCPHSCRFCCRCWCRRWWRGGECQHIINFTVCKGDACSLTFPHHLHSIIMPFWGVAHCVWYHSCPLHHYLTTPVSVTITPIQY